MNNACKSSRHEWCAPMSTVRHHIKTEHSRIPAPAELHRLLRLPAAEYSAFNVTQKNANLKVEP
jgi:hypothetical protein